MPWSDRHNFRPSAQVCGICWVWDGRTSFHWRGDGSNDDETLPVDMNGFMENEWTWGNLWEGHHVFCAVSASRVAWSTNVLYHLDLKISCKNHSKWHTCLCKHVCSNCCLSRSHVWIYLNYGSWQYMIEKRETKHSQQILLWLGSLCLSGKVAGPAGLPRISASQKYPCSRPATFDEYAAVSLVLQHWADGRSSLLQRILLLCLFVAFL